MTQRRVLNSRSIHPRRVSGVSLREQLSVHFGTVGFLRVLSGTGAKPWTVVIRENVPFYQMTPEANGQETAPRRSCRMPTNDRIWKAYIAIRAAGLGHFRNNRFPMLRRERIVILGEIVRIMRAYGSGRSHRSVERAPSPLGPRDCSPVTGERGSPEVDGDPWSRTHLGRVAEGPRP